MSESTAVLGTRDKPRWCASCGSPAEDHPDEPGGHRCPKCGEENLFALSKPVSEESSTSDLEALEKRFNTVGALWHDAYCEWQVKVDAQRRTFDDCRHSFWGETLSEACAKALLAAKNDETPT